MGTELMRFPRPGYVGTRAWLRRAGAGIRRTAPHGRGPRRAAAVLLLLAATGCIDGGDNEGKGSDVPRVSREWRIEYAGDSHDGYIEDVAAGSADEGWALGFEAIGGYDGDDRYFMLHLKDGKWTRAGLPPQFADPASMQMNVHLDASAPDNVWLFAGGIGSPESGRAVRWDGNRWRDAPVRFGVRDVLVLAPDDVWALTTVGSLAESFVRHWDGTRWKKYSLPFDVESLSASSSDNIWAAGKRRNDAGHSVQPEFSRFDGHKWRSTEAPEYHSSAPDTEETTYIHEVVAISPEEAWAFGTFDFSREDSSVTKEKHVTLRWNGSRWQKEPNLVNRPWRVSPDGAGGLVLGAAQHRTADGKVHPIKNPRLLPGRSGKITKADRLQAIHLNELVRVPGTQEVWGIGGIGTGVDEDYTATEFVRPVIISYTPGR